MRPGLSGGAAKPMLSRRSPAPSPPPAPAMEMFCEEASYDNLSCEPSPEPLGSGWLGDSCDDAFESPAAPTFATQESNLFRKPAGGPPSQGGGGGPKKEKAESADGAGKIKTMLQRDTLLHLGESPTQEALRDCLDIVKSLIKAVTEGVRNGNLTSSDDRWREFVSKLMDYSEALEEAIASGNADAAQEALKAAQPELMRGVSKGVYHKNTASRKMSRLSSRVKALSPA